MPLTQRAAQIINTQQSELAAISWNDGEANTDSGFSKLACKACKEAWGQIQSNYLEYENISIECDKPDLSIKFYKDDAFIMERKIELKSCKGKVLIGSTIRNLDINQPVIFCLRNEVGKPFEIRYSQYHTCMGESDTDLFQDRTPRPGISFDKMKEIGTTCDYIHKEKTDWVEHYAECALKRINRSIDSSWQDKLTVLIITKFIQETSIEDFTTRKAKLSSPEGGDNSVPVDAGINPSL